MPACGGNYTFIDIANPWVGDGGEAVVVVVGALDPNISNTK